MKRAPLRQHDGLLTLARKLRRGDANLSAELQWFTVRIEFCYLALTELVASGPGHDGGTLG
jgi:hypothetical protein